MSERRDRLLSYIGREYTEEVVAQMNKEFAPYRVRLCELDSFYLENLLGKSN